MNEDVVSSLNKLQQVHNDKMKMSQKELEIILGESQNIIKSNVSHK